MMKIKLTQLFVGCIVLQKSYCVMSENQGHHRAHCKMSSSLIKEERITLENQRLAAHFSSGMLDALEDKVQKTNVNVTLSFGKYYSCVGGGAYLLKICDLHRLDWILKKEKPKVILYKGPVISQLNVLSGKLKFSAWIVNTGDSEITSTLFMKNEVITDKIEDGEYFMRFQTDLISTQPSETKEPQPIFFTDTNGFAVEKRVIVPNLPYQANHYPMTHFAHIQDDSKKLRFTVLVDRAHGVSSMISGNLEMIFDRVLQFDDGRGMDEGVLDTESAVSNYAIKLESTKAFSANKESYHSWEPSLAVQKASKYLDHPPTIFTYDAMKGDDNGNVTIFSSDFPQDIFLLNLRTLSGASESIKSVPRNSALMTVYRMGHITSEACSNQPVYSSKLSTVLRLNHTLRKTNLVGTVVENNNGNRVQYNDTQYLSVDKFYEMYSYYVDM